MQDIDGGLGFKAGIDLDDFNVSADAMKSKFKDVSSSITEDTEGIDQSLMDMARNGARYITGILIGQGLYGLAQSIISVRGEFQQLEIAFETMLGSKSKAKALMDQMVQTAAKTPFDLHGVAEGAKQLMAYGLSAEKVNDTLVRLGNIAAGLSIPLNDIVYLYGTTMVQGRLYAQDVRQFTGRGIPLVKELAKQYGVTADKINEMVSAGKIGFADVQRVLKGMTDEGGQFYNLMEKQSASLTGMISNLDDALDSAKNKVGEDLQGVFATGIGAVTSLVESFDNIINIVKHVAAAYGIYRASLALVTLATKGQTGIALIDNTVHRAKIALLKMEETATGQLAAKQKIMAAAQAQKIASLEAELTVQEQANLQTRLRAEAIQSLLTAEQQQYLTTIGLTTTTAGYEQKALEVMTVEQKEALTKIDLSKNSAIYQAALQKEVIAKKEGTLVNQELMSQQVAEAAQLVEYTKLRAISAAQIAEQAREKLALAQATGNASKITRAQLVLDNALKRKEISDNQALNAQSILLQRQKQQEAFSHFQSAAATTADTAAKQQNAVASGLLTRVTKTLSGAFKGLWATMVANPFTAIMTAVGAVALAFHYFSGKVKDATEKEGTLAHAMNEADKEYQKQEARVNTLMKLIHDESISIEERKKKIVELKGIVKGYNAEISEEGKIVRENTAAVSEYLNVLEKQIRLKMIQGDLEKIYEQRFKAQREIDNAELMKKSAYGTKDDYWTNLAYNSKGANGGVQSQSEIDVQKYQGTIDKNTRVLNELQKQEADLRNEYQKTSEAMKESAEKATSLSEQLQTAENNLNKAQKELADLRKGKGSHADFEKEINDKEKEIQGYQNTIATLKGSKKRSGSGGGSSTSASDMEEKAYQSHKKTEEARIQLMEDGYEKRKALLDLQHKDNLRQIEKEEKEIMKARKGKLSEEEQTAFNNRKKYENENYLKEQNKLFDGEIQYKKQQYTLYYRWVENMGADVANKRFSELLKSGKSYSEYINNEIKKLQQKKEAGTITEGETNYLISLNLQQKEIYGAKSALEQFKESISDTIRRASTLGEKLNAIAEAKKKIAEGGNGLNPDENLQISTELDQEELKVRKEIEDKVVELTKDYEERKKTIREEYQIMRLEAIKKGDENAVRLINEGENEALSALNASMLMQSDSWKNLFSDLDSLTVEQIQKLIKDIETQMSNIDLKLKPADMKALLDKLQEAKQMVIEANPFAALGSALSSIFSTGAKESKKSTAEIKRDWNNLGNATKGVFDFVLDAAENCGVLRDIIGDSGVATIKLVEGVTTAGIAMAAAIKTAETSSIILTSISLAMSAVNLFSNLFNNDKKHEKKIKQIQEEIDALDRSLKRLSHAMEDTQYISSPEERQSQKERIAYIKQQIALLEEEQHQAARLFDFKKYAEFAAKIAKLKKELKEAMASGDMIALAQREEEMLKEKQELLKKKIEEEQKKKKPNKKAIQEWKNEIEDIDQQIEDNKKKMIQVFAGTDVKSAIDSFADAITEAWMKNGDAAEAAATQTKNLLRKAILDALKRQFLAKAVQDAMDFLGKAMQEHAKDGTSLTEEEKKKFADMMNSAGKTYKDALDAIGDWLKEADELTDPLKGAAKAITEEQAGVLAGRMNAIVINQAEGIAVTKAILKDVAEINMNVRNIYSLLMTMQLSIGRKNWNFELLSRGVAV